MKAGEANENSGRGRKNQCQTNKSNSVIMPKPAFDIDDRSCPGPRSGFRPGPASGSRAGHHSLTSHLVWHAVCYWLLWKLIHRWTTLFPVSRCARVTIATEYGTGTGLMCSSGTHGGVENFVSILHSYRQRFEKL